MARRRISLDGKLLRIVTARPNAGGYRVRREGRQFVETPLATKRLNDKTDSRVENPHA